MVCEVIDLLIANVYVSALKYINTEKWNIRINLLWWLLDQSRPSSSMDILKRSRR